MTNESYRYSSLYGPNLKVARQAHGLKQGVVARAANMSPPMLSGIEAGVLPITYDVGERIVSGLRSLGVDVRTLKNRRVPHYWAHLNATDQTA